MRANISLALAKLETTYNTDPVPSPTVPADVLLFRTAEVMPIEAQRAERPRLLPYHGNRGKPGLYAHAVRLTGQLPLCGAGAAGSAPAWSKALRMCGMAEVITASTSAEYAPVSGGFESGELYWYQDGVRHKAGGMRGTFGLNITAGEEPTLQLELSGLYPEDPAAITFPAAPSFSAWRDGVIPRAGITTCTIGGQTFSMQRFGYTHAGAIAIRDKPGIREVRIGDRTPTAEVVIDTPDGFSPTNFIAAAKAEAETPVLITHGTVAGDIIEVRLPQARILNGIRYGADGDVSQLTIPLMPRPTMAGNNELLITVK
jgi:hypothetical protein